RNCNCTGSLDDPCKHLLFVFLRCHKLL
ncbi:SWIM zinc finger family protein, partial [Prevotella pectinovora]